MIRKICNFLIVMILMVIIAVAGPILVLQLLGYEPMAILSGSMEPTYRLGGLIFIDTNVLPEDIQKGDSIAFHFGDDMVVTHRVLSIDSEDRTYVTRGDANNVEDAPISFDQLIGRAWLYIPLLGYILLDLGTFKGLAYGLILLAVLIGLFVTSALLAPKDNGEESSAADEMHTQREARVEEMTYTPQKALVEEMTHTPREVPVEEMPRTPREAPVEEMAYTPQKAPFEEMTYTPRKASFEEMTHAPREMPVEGENKTERLPKSEDSERSTISPESTAQPHTLNEQTATYLEQMPELTMQTPTLALQVSALSEQADSLSRQVSTFVDQASVIAGHASSIFDQASAIIDQASAIIDQASDIATRATATFNQASSIIAQMSGAKVQQPVEGTTHKARLDEEELLPGIHIFFPTTTEYGNE